MHAQLQIDNYVLTKVSLEYNGSFFDEGQIEELWDTVEAMELDVDFNLFNVGEDQNRVGASLSLSCGDDRKDPVMYSLELFGWFSLDPDITPEERDKVLPLNPVAMLHGIARGILGQLMGRGPIDGYVLPAVNFFEVQRKKIEAERKKTASGKRTAKRRKKKSRVKH